MIDNMQAAQNCLKGAAVTLQAAEGMPLKQADTQIAMVEQLVNMAKVYAMLAAIPLGTGTVR